MIRFGVVVGVKAEGDQDETPETLEQVGLEIMGKGPDQFEAALDKMTDEQLAYFLKEVTAAAAMVGMWGVMAIEQRDKRKRLAAVAEKDLIAC